MRFRRIGGKAARVMTMAALAALGAMVPAAAAADPPEQALPVEQFPQAAAAAPGAADADAASAAPEPATGFSRRHSVRAAQFMVVTANPLATGAAHDVLARGGSAVDAVIAAQMMLTLVEPQSSGIGGGAFLLTYDAASGGITAWDGRETAPLAADHRLFLDPQGRPLPFFDAVVGGRAVGVPGAVRMLEAAHRAAGKLPWADLLQPAIETASSGFIVSPRLHALVSRDRFLRDDPVAAAYFHDADGKPLQAGSLLRNPELAETLQLLAEHGSRHLHAGDLASDIIDKVRGHPRNPGLMTLADLDAYRALGREPVCTPWLRWVVCGMPPPSSGGIAVAQMLGILESLPFAGLTANGAALDARAAHFFAEAGRLAYADRDRYVADSDFVPLPPGLLDGSYLRRRAARVGERSMGIAAAGDPSASDYPEGGTSHVSVVDADGNAAALTTSIENAFGSRQMVGGFLLNNQLTDFTLVTGPAKEVANRLQPGKRPRSSMSPTLVFEQQPAAPDAAEGAPATAPRRGRLVMVTGSPGGSMIINYVAKTLIATLQDGLDPLDAISLPNLGSRNGPTELERGLLTPDLADALRARGHEIREVDMTSGVHSVTWHCDDRQIPRCAWLGAADPRREGTARGG